MYLKSVVSVMAVLGVAACGGGTTGGGASYEDVLSDFRSSPLLELGDAGADEFETAASLAAGGSAEYTGSALIFLTEDFGEIASEPEVDLAGVEDLPDPSLIGTVSLSTTFTSADEGTVVGSFANFVDSDGNVKSGSIAVTDGAVGNFFGVAALGATFNGSLSGPGAGNQEYNGDLLGFFAPGGVIGIGAESLEDEVNDEASFAIVFAAEN